jgi:hypothetical protein
VCQAPRVAHWLTLEAAWQSEERSACGASRATRSHIESLPSFRNFDFVRLEIGAALARNVRIILVLLDDAVMSTEESLPSLLVLLRDGTQLR